MPTQVNSNYSANFQKFVDFANKAYATKGEDTVVRFSGMPSGDYKGSFASFFRTSSMKTANDQVRELFLKTVADMFGGERNIPDIVRDAMKMEDFGKGKPLTARRIQLVKSAIDIVGGGMFSRPSSVDKAMSAGYLPHEMSKLARIAAIFRNATGCTEAEAEAAALDPSSKARRLYEYGGRFVKNADSFKAGLALMDKFVAWYDDLVSDKETNARDTLTKLNLNYTLCIKEAQTAVEKFVFEEISVNDRLPLDATNPEDVFGMEKNPAMQFVGRGYATSLSTSLAHMQPEKRELIYSVFNVLSNLPRNAKELTESKKDNIEYGLLVTSRVMKNYDTLAALQKSGKLDRASLVPIIYSDLDVSPTAGNAAIARAYHARLWTDPGNMPAIHLLVENSGVTIDEATEAVKSGTRIENAPGIMSFSAELKDLDGTANGGRKTMITDLNRPTSPTYIADETLAIADEDSKFVVNFPDGETLEAATGLSTDQNVIASGNAIADKIAELCGNVHPKQLSNVYYALSQSAISSNVNGGFRAQGIASNEHMAVTFTLSRNNDTGAVTIKYSEPKGMPFKFNWTTTIDVEGKSVTTPMRIDHGQYEAKAMTFAGEIANSVPGKDPAAAEAIVKDMLAYCGDDFELKDIVSQSAKGIAVGEAAELRTADQIKARIDAVRANLEEVRRAAAGNAAVEKAGCFFLAALNGKSVQPGLIGQIVKNARVAQPGEFSKLSASATPQQIVKALVDMRAAAADVMRGANVADFLEGEDETGAARDFAVSLILARFTAGQLQGAKAALRSETSAKLVSVLDDFAAGRHPAGVAPVADNLLDGIKAQSTALKQIASQYSQSVERMLEEDGGPQNGHAEPFDAVAFGAKDIFKTVASLAVREGEVSAENARRDQIVQAELELARAKARDAYSKAGQGNAGTVDKLITIALRHCAANEDAARIVASNMDALLVSNTASLRSLEQVRERADAVAANFEELQELSKDNPAVYDAGKRMIAALKGKSLPPGMIAKLLAEASNAKLDAIRRLSPKSSAMDIHRAVTQLRDNLVNAMETSGAEMAMGGPDEKQACRNFLAAMMVGRCGANTLRAMQGAFAGDLASKLQAFYVAVGDGLVNEDLDIEQQLAFKLEDTASAHASHISALKVAIDFAADGDPGNGIALYKEPFDADEFGGPDIVDDLVKLASH